MTAALALEAAGAQGSFWEMHDSLVRVDGDIDIESVRAAAEELGLNVDGFEKRIARQVDRSRIEDDNLDLEDAETGSAPIVYINGIRFDRPLNSFALIAGVRRAQE